MQLRLRENEHGNRKPRNRDAKWHENIGGRESSVHLRVKWTVDKINRDGRNFQHSVALSRGRLRAEKPEEKFRIILFVSCLVRYRHPPRATPSASRSLLLCFVSSTPRRERILPKNFPRRGPVSTPKEIS